MNSQRTFFAGFSLAARPISFHRTQAVGQRAHDASKDSRCSFFGVFARRDQHGFAPHQETLEHWPRKKGFYLYESFAPDPDNIFRPLPQPTRPRRSLDLHYSQSVSIMCMKKAHDRQWSPRKPFN
ncbi:hypothetical protein SK128_003761 [Halocaridina rubra]|uniref:Uncharacterized protein n=1 Tax=Halocaridina rubra TaxID=373956 RepID=A0AAN9A4K4_HALRR